MNTSGMWWKILAAGAAFTVVLFVADIALIAVVGEPSTERFDTVSAQIETGAAPSTASTEGASSGELTWNLDEPVPQPGAAPPEVSSAEPAEPYSTEFGSPESGEPYAAENESANQSYAYESEGTSADFGSSDESYAYESGGESPSYETAGATSSYGSSEGTQSFGSAVPLYPAAPYSSDDEEPVAQKAPAIDTENDSKNVLDRKSGGGGPSLNVDGTSPGIDAGNSATSAPPADPQSEVDRKLAALPLGNIAFNTPDTVGLDDAATIELLVSLKETEDALREAVRGAGKIEGARVKLSNRMEARLSGMNFRIESITPEQQAISSSERTAWRWQIQPTKSDKLELHLTLSALLTIDGEPTARAIRTFDRTILVDVPFGQRLTNAATDHIELITSAILIPVLGGVYRQYRKRKRRTLPPPSADTPTRRAA